MSDRIRRALHNNLLLKLVSLALSMVLFFAVRSGDSEKRPKKVVAKSPSVAQYNKDETSPQATQVSSIFPY